MNTINILLAVSFGFAIMWTAAWILRVIVMVVQKDGKVSSMQTIYMSFSWAVFYFLLLQRWGDYIDQTHDGEPISERFDNDKVLYHMNLSDIPMPEGWL